MTPEDQTSPELSGYGRVLSEYLKTHGEEALYQASILSQEFVENGIGPDEIIAIHFEALEAIMPGLSYREQARAIADAHQFLLEVMIAYGVRYREYLEMRVRDSIREAEARATLDRQRALEAEQAEREKNEILGMIAHELRTPLTAARGNLDFAVRSLSRGQMERLQPLLGSAVEALERLSRLTADLIEASRGEPPQLAQARQDLASILAQACTWVRAVAGAKNITLETSFDVVPLPVLGNADALLTVFGNLLSNAVRYTPEGGKVTVSCGTNSPMASVEIRDTGIGMTPEVQEHIFDRFYRGPEARNLESRGLGLGLALAHQMVQAHRGRIEVESVPGQGSTFRVLLPVIESESDVGSIGGAS